jgi:hypothetical protein
MASPRSRNREQNVAPPTEKWTRPSRPSTVDGVTTESPTLHVRAASRGGWLVVDEDRDAAPLSEHPDATTALRAARDELLARGGDGEVLVHDRYHRVRRRFTPGTR